VRVFAAKRGLEPRAFTLLPFGGAGAVHAAAVAEELGLTRILVPPRPGAFSALGLLCSDVVHDYIRSELMPLDQLQPAHAETLFAELEARARAELKAEGLDDAQADLGREMDLRYTGQGYELRVGLDGLGALDAAGLNAARERFDTLHARIHGHAAAEKPVEMVSYRLRARVAVPKVEARELPTPMPDIKAALKGPRTVWFDGRNPTEVPVYERDRLARGAALPGPAIIEQMDATTLIPQDWDAAVDSQGNLILTNIGNA
jgi:N-methylhydantoinase A